MTRNLLPLIDFREPAIFIHITIHLISEKVYSEHLIEHLTVSILYGAVGENRMSGADS